MKNAPTPKKTVVTFLLILLLGLLTWLVLHFWPKSQEGGNDTRNSQVGETLKTPKQRTPTPAEQKALEDAKEAARWKWWNEQKAKDRSFEWKMPIAFYGLVLDTEDKPVEGATAYFQWTDVSAEGTSDREILSQPDGRFELTGVQGKRMGVYVLKDGYYPVTKGRKGSFEYAAFFEPNYHEPDPAKPVIYRLRKAKPPEEQPQLLLRATRIGITPDGSAHYIDMRAMKKSEEKFGDIAVKMTRGRPDGPVGVSDSYDWTVSVEGMRGTEILESDDEFMFEAPLEGYQPSYSYSMPKNMENWHAEIEKQYYVKGRDGSFYARLGMRFDPEYRDEAAVFVRFYVNASGSRDLECHPNKPLLP